MNKILIFAGTMEGRKLAEYLSANGIECYVCVATEYGEKLLPKGDTITVSSERLSEEEMERLMRTQTVTMVIDATHPYATEVTKNIQAACKSTKVEYIRLLRKSGKEEAGDCIYKEQIEEVVAYLKEVTGNVLVTTGSKELAKFITLPDYQNRLHARVLSSPKVVEECAKLGFEGKNLICMQGPFSEELNYAMLRQINARYLVTKESGAAGGFQEKIQAAKRAGVTTIVIGRPTEETGYSLEECLEMLENRFQISERKKIILLGIGMGNYDTMTVEGVKACEKADVIIGAKRMVEALSCFQKPTHIAYQPEEIKGFLASKKEYRTIVIALSGDVGFYSGAKKLISTFSEEEVTVLPGISSLVYLCAKCKIPWQDITLTSMHGKEEQIIAAVHSSKRVFSLLGNNESIQDFCKQLIETGLEDVLLTFGEHLSYENENITSGNPKEFLDTVFEEPCVVLIENRKADGKVVTHGIADEEFLRGKVPMTKEEIRSISLSKLKLKKDSVIYDIGAGTGSVSIEMALQSDQGKVFAIEKKEEAVSLIEANKYKFGTTNVVAISGIAPEALSNLPTPTHAFIGGSSGNLDEIIALLLARNPEIRIVLNAITMETVSEMMECIKKYDLIEEDVVQVSIAKSQKVGRYHMMSGQNPITIISCKGGKQDETIQNLN